MKKIVSLVMTVMVLLAALGSGVVFAEDAATVIELSETEMVQTDAKNYVRAIESGVQVEGDYLVPRMNIWMEYDVNAPKEGLYDIHMYVGNSDSNMPVKTTVNSGATKKTIFAKTTSYTSKTKCLVTTAYLKEGLNTIRIESLSGGFYYRYISFTPNNGDVIEVQNMEYTDKNTNEEGVHISFQYQHWIKYEVGVNETAYYNVYGIMEGANTTATRTNLTVTANEGKTLSETSSVSIQTSATSAWFDVAGKVDGKYLLGKVRLFEGANTVKITNNSNGFYLEGIVLEKLATEIAAEGVTEISAQSYTSAYCNAGIASGGETIHYDVKPEGSNLSFQYLDWTEYSIIAPVEGEYKLKAYTGAPYAMKMDALINGTDTFNCIFAGNESGYGRVWYDIGKVTLKEGRNTIKISNPSGGYYFTKLSLERILPELSPFSTIPAMEYNLGGQNVAYFDTTLIGGIETINEDTAVELTDTEWFKYDIEVPVSGEYGIRLSVAAEDTDAKSIKITNGSETVEFTAVCTGTIGVSDFILTDMQILNLSAGTNTLKIESVSGTWYMDSFSLYRPDVTFLSGDVETEVVPEGVLSAEIMFGGLMIGEEVEYYLAVYEVNEHNHTKLIGVDMGGAVVTESTIATMEVENVEKNENCTYTAKVFLWNNMTGAVYPIS